MNYAVDTDRPYITKKKVLLPTPLSVDAKERQAYIRSHRFKVEVDAETQKCKLIVIPKD